MTDAKQDVTVVVEKNQNEAEPGSAQTDSDAGKNMSEEIAESTVSDDDAVSSRQTNVQNNFIQNMDQAAVNVEQTQSARPDTVRMQQMVDIVNQVVEKIKVSLGTESTSMEMQLNPEHLGKVLLNVSSKNGMMTAVFSVQSEEAKAALESQMFTLRENLELRELKVDAVEVNVSDFDFSYFKTVCKKARVFFTKKRINVRWGTQSQVRTELLLYESAFSNGPYQYYHLLSGVDLPLKTQDEIHAFFSGKQCEYIYNKTELSNYDIARVANYHFFIGSKKRLTNTINIYLARVQGMLNINRIKHLDFPIRRGHNWCDLTNRAVQLLIQKKRQILKITKFSICADEVYKQTFLQNQGLMIENDDLRLVDWVRSPNGNNPHVFTIDDWDMLSNSNKLFARKFDTAVDKEVVDELFNHINMRHRGEL